MRTRTIFWGKAARVHSECISALGLENRENLEKWQIIFQKGSLRGFDQNTGK